MVQLRLHKWRTALEMNTNLSVNQYAQRQICHQDAFSSILACVEIQKTIGDDAPDVYEILIDRLQELCTGADKEDDCSWKPTSYEHSYDASKNLFRFDAHPAGKNFCPNKKFSYLDFHLQ